MIDTKHLTQPQTLTELGVVGVSLIVAIAYQHHQQEKTGKDALLTKLPIFKHLTPFKSATYAVDVDLSCVVLDKTGNVLDTIWYGNLRNANQSIRHSGDSLHGADCFEQNLINQEEIHLRLTQLDEQVAHLMFFINSYHQDILSQIPKGISKLSDNEEHLLGKLVFSTLDEQSTGILAWHIQKTEGDFLVSAPCHPVIMTDTTPDHFAQNLIKLAQAYWQSTNSSAQLII